jgi:heme/copper-type cytochrome/quinol oxidase subunit 2
MFIFASSPKLPMLNKKGEDGDGAVSNFRNIIILVAIFLVIVFILLTWANPAFGNIIKALPFG